MPGFQAVYQLPGRKTVHKTSVFSHAEDAGNLLAATIELYPGATGSVEATDRPAEIVRHCGDEIQAIGCPCPVCREIVTPDSHLSAEQED